MPTQPQQTGMVLIIVLWIVTLLAMLAGGFSYAMQIETRLATSTVERAQARALAEAGVAYALIWQTDPETKKQWPANGDARDWEFGGGLVRIRVEDSAGRINLNHGDPKLLTTTLQGLGLDEKDAERIAMAILDWRDPDDQSGAEVGSESATYREAGYPGAKNIPFESSAELQQIPGISPALAQQLARISTVEAGGMGGGVDAQLASLEVLQALTGLDSETLSDYIKSRSQALAENLPPPPLPENPASSFLNSGMGGNGFGTYHVNVTAQVGSGATVSAEVVASVQNPPPGQALRWISWRFNP